MESQSNFVWSSESRRLQTESRYIECQMNEINFLISLAWTEGGLDVDDLGGKAALFLLTRFINLFYLLKIIMGIRSPHMLEEVVGLRRIVSLLLP